MLCDATLFGTLVLKYLEIKEREMYTVVPPNSRLIGSQKNPGIRKSGDLITVVNRSSQKLLLSKKKDI